MPLAEKGDKVRRREELLGSALAVFSERGYHAARVEDIVARAGVARGTFYLYFADKRAVFDTLVEGFLERLRASVAAIRPDEPFEPQLTANVAGVLDLMLGEPDMTRVLLSHAAGVDPALDRRLDAFHDALVALLERALRRGQAMGIVRPCDTKVVAYLFLGGVREVVYRLVVAGVPLERGSLAETLLAQGLYGLIVKETAAC